MLLEMLQCVDRAGSQCCKGLSILGTERLAVAGKQCARLGAEVDEASAESEQYSGERRSSDGNRGDMAFPLKAVDAKGLP